MSDYFREAYQPSQRTRQSSAHQHDPAHGAQAIRIEDCQPPIPAPRHAQEPVAPQARKIVPPRDTSSPTAPSFIATAKFLDMETGAPLMLSRAISREAGPWRPSATIVQNGCEYALQDAVDEREWEDPNGDTRYELTFYYKKVTVVNRLKALAGRLGLDGFRVSMALFVLFLLVQTGVIPGLLAANSVVSTDPSPDIAVELGDYLTSGVPSSNELVSPGETTSGHRLADSDAELGAAALQSTLTSKPELTSDGIPVYVELIDITTNEPLSKTIMHSFPAGNFYYISIPLIDGYAADQEVVEGLIPEDFSGSITRQVYFYPVSDTASMETPEPARPSAVDTATPVKDTHPITNADEAPRP